MELGTYELALVVLGAGVIAAAVALWVITSRAENQRRLDKLRWDAERFFSRLQESGTLPDVAVNVVLQKDEIALLREDGSQLAESRAYRVYGGGGTRIRGVYVAVELRNLTSGFGRSTRAPSF